MSFDTIISRLLSSVQSLELVEWYEIHRKFHVGCGGVSSVQRDRLSLFSLLNDSLQSTSQLRKGIAVVHGCLAEVVLDCGICTVFKKKIHTIDVSSSELRSAEQWIPSLSEMFMSPDFVNLFRRELEQVCKYFAT